MIGIILLVFQASAVQSPENPIPATGGAIKFAEQQTVSELPHAIDAGWRGEKGLRTSF